jgi:hypothetical protein
VKPEKSLVYDAAHDGHRQGLLLVALMEALGQTLSTMSSVAASGGICNEAFGDGDEPRMYCTREQGHASHHVASGLDMIVGVWER